MSQTDGPDLPEMPGSELLGGEGPAGLWDALAGQVAGHGYALRRGPVGAGALGYTSGRSREVVVGDSLGGADAAHVLGHELGHIECGHLDDRRQTVSGPRRELEAESVSWLVCQAAGLASDASSFGYVAGWADGGRGDWDAALTAVRETFAVVCEAADRITTALHSVHDPAEAGA